jgi:hypothetical protein
MFFSPCQIKVKTTSRLTSNLPIGKFTFYKQMDRVFEQAQKKPLQSQRL